MVRFISLVQQAGAVGHDRVRIASFMSGHLFALCDGAGGTPGAGGAADFVTEHLVCVSRPAHTNIRTLLVEVLHHIDHASALAASAGLTTALVAVVADGMVQGASVGDSEAWLVLDTGEVVLTSGQHRKPLVGSRRCSAVAFGPVPMCGTLVLGSDGLFKYCPHAKLLSIARSADLNAIPELLLDASRLPSGRLQDDFAVVVCRDTA